MMPTRLIVTERTLEAALRMLRGAEAIFGDIGLNRHRDGTEWLLRRVRPITTWAGREPGVILTLSPVLRSLASVPTAVLVLPRDGPPTAQVVHPDGRREPLAWRLIAPGLPEVLAAEAPMEPTVHDVPEVLDPRWSRIVGALGEPGWYRLRQLHYALIGCGRTGSLLAHSLVRTGARRLTLVDPDFLQRHNLDGDGMLPEAIGRPKVHALAESLRAINPAVELHPLAHSVTEAEILPILKSADVLICATDHDGARWACGLLAALYLKPLLDIGTGISNAEGTERMGADVRWIVPGECCLLCLGGLARPEHLAPVRESLAREDVHRRDRHWRDERRGSLRSLNQVATGLALRMLEDYLTAHLPHSLWLRLTYTGPIPEIRNPSPHRPERARRTRCFCSLTGGGDQVLQSLHIGVPLEPPQISHSHESHAN